MIIWRGSGVLVIGVVFLVSLVTNAVFDAICGKGFYDTHTWAAGIAVMISGPINWFIGKRFDARGGKTVIDQQSGKVITLDKPHLFFLPLRFWGPILFVVGAVVFVMNWK